MSHALEVHDLRILIETGHSLLLIEEPEEGRAVGLVKSVGFKMNIPVQEWSISTGLSNNVAIQLERDPESPTEVLKKIQSSTEPSIYVLKDFAPFFEDPLVTRLLLETAHKLRTRKSAVVLTGASTIPPSLKLDTYVYRLKPLSKDELDRQVRSIFSSFQTTTKIKVQLNESQYSDLLNALGGLGPDQVKRLLGYVMLHDGTLSSEDIQAVLEKKSEILKSSGALEFYPLHDHPAELGGFEGLKKWLAKVKIGFGEEAKKFNLPAPKGAMITGIQGCGKSLSAKFIAKHLGFPLLKLEAGKLYDKFVGESEKNLDRAIQAAEAMSPCVLWIDEIEKAVSSEGGSGDDAGLGKRLLGRLLTWLQEKRKPVFVLATANDLFRLPPELMRKGRFDEIFFVDLPNDLERKKILEIHLKLRNLDPTQFDFTEWVKCTQGFSGAELEQNVISGIYAAIHEESQISSVHFLQAARNTRPLSVTRREEIERIREMARDRFVPVN